MEHKDRIAEKRYLKFGPFEGVMEEVPCRLCGENSNSKLIYKNKEGIGFYQCENCDLMYASPRFMEESMLKISENEAFTDLSMFDRWSYAEWGKSRGRSYNISSQKVLLLKRYLPAGSRILDVGCGTGLFVLESIKSDFLGEGIEPSSRLSDIGRNVLKVPIATLQIEEFNAPYSFKGIVIWDVLEHLYDPVRVVKRCAELLESGGFLFAQVPNYRGFSNSLKTSLCRIGLKKSGLKHFGFPWHVYSFDKKSLTNLMNISGLKAIHFESWSHLRKINCRDYLSQIIIKVTKTLCLSDYLVCIAQKSSK